MVVVPAEKFMMGSPADEPERSSNEGPQHQVTISQPFAVSKYPVTRGQFQAFIDDTGYDAGSGKDSWLDPGFSQTHAHPVVCVSWDDAKAYIDWLKTQTGEDYRLLSEAEWEYVARAGTTTAYHFGDKIFPKNVNYRDERYGTVEIGSCRPNEFGLYNVHGNVWEWVEDCWHNDYTGALTDGSAWVNDCHSDKRVLRGGSWGRNATSLRSASRFTNNAWNRYKSDGFRIARTLSR